MFCLYGNQELKNFKFNLQTCILKKKIYIFVKVLVLARPLNILTKYVRKIKRKIQNNMLFSFPCNDKLKYYESANLSLPFFNHVQREAVGSIYFLSLPLINTTECSRLKWYKVHDNIASYFYQSWQKNSSSLGERSL